jgi:sugar/nucleoside kinase (ribokinase family)
MALFRAAHPTTTQLRSTIEWTARRLVALRPRVGAVVRAGALGACYVLTSELPAGSLTDVHLPVPPCVPVHWVPAYWTPGADGYEGAVVDPTGAGNAFMGGLMAALDEGKGIDEGEFRELSESCGRVGAVQVGTRK